MVILNIIKITTILTFLITDKKKWQVKILNIALFDFKKLSETDMHHLDCAPITAIQGVRVMVFNATINNISATCEYYRVSQFYC
jgi:hypothetical protein